jgi:uncharacterized protein (TIGR03067 family)
VGVTTRAAVRFANTGAIGEGAASARLTDLAEGFLQTRRAARQLVAAAALLTLASLALILWFLVFRTPEGPPAADPDARLAVRPVSDLDRLQGGWTAVNTEIDGQKRGDLNVRMVFTGNRLLLDFNNPAFPPLLLTVELAEGDPKLLDLTRPGVPPVLGIYRLEGDRLRICYDLDGAVRPREFATEPGSHCILYDLKRDQPGGEKGGERRSSENASRRSEWQKKRTGRA